jgi:N6-adenosine-specific RNA methylase IME4
VDEHGATIDGHHRLRAVAELRAEGHAVDYPSVVRTGLTDAEKRARVRTLNLARRQLTPEQKRAVVADQLRESPEWGDRALGRLLGVSHHTAASVRAELEASGQIAQIAARQVERGGTAYLQAPKRGPSIIATTTREARRAVRLANQAVSLPRDAPLTLSQARDAVRLVEQQRRVAALAVPGAFPPGRYPILYADPPWRFEDATPPNRQVENQYPTMPLDAICGLTDAAGRTVAELAAPDAVLFLWSPVAKLAEALAVLAAWGFSYRTALVWEKEQVGLGHYVRQRYELLLLGRRGAFPAPAEPGRPDAKIVAPRGRHSEKPAIVYDLIERMYPGVGPRVELFARTARPGWARWGGEAPA